MSTNTAENKDKQFLKDFADWTDQQVVLMAKAQQLAEMEGEQEANIRYESRLDAYRFIQGKFNNYRQGKAFHDLPDDFAL